MESNRKKIYGFLRGSFLTDDTSIKNWGMIIYVVFLVLIMISSAHYIDKKGILISQLHKKKRELRAEYIDVGTILMQLKMESTIRENALKIGLKPSEIPPKKIIVTNKK